MFCKGEFDEKVIFAVLALGRVLGLARVLWGVFQVSIKRIDGPEVLVAWITIGVAVMKSRTVMAFERGLVYEGGSTIWGLTNPHPG